MKNKKSKINKIGLLEKIEDNYYQIHLRVDHTQEFVKDAIHTNGIESFWATLKRGVLGIDKYSFLNTKIIKNKLNSKVNYATA